jgi:hypothetical protein
MLVLLGFLLQSTPSLIGARVRQSEARQAFLFFSTFGGGNRGSLAVALTAPALMPVFILIDLGNFLSLTLLFPWLAQRQTARDKLSLTAFAPVYWSLTAFVVGMTLHETHPGSPVIDDLYPPVKWALVALTSFQIGQALHFNKACLTWVLRYYWRVRLMALILPVALVLAWPGLSWEEPLLALLLFAILPVSSLAVSMLPQDAGQEFRERLSCAVTASTALYLILLLAALGLHRWLG